jgi:hypothetical protein
MIRAGNKMRLVNIEINNVVEVSKPSATVPPKSEKAKMINPANNTADV